MKVAIVTPWAISADAIGGTERFTIDLAEGLSKRGHKCTVFMLSGASHHANRVAYVSLDILGNGQTASEYDLQGMMGDFSEEAAYERLAKRVESLADLHGFDVVQINSLLLLKVWPQHTRIFTIHTNPYEYTMDWGATAFKRSMDLLRVEADRPQTVLTVPSAYYADQFAGLAGCSPVCIPHAIDRSRLQCAASQTDIRKRYELNEHKLTILLPSRLELQQKRPQVVFEAVTHLPQGLIDKIQVVAAGLDSQYEANQALLAKIARTKRLEAHFRRFDTMAEAYKLADYVALPSCSESFGYSALEALTLNRTTLLNNLPTFREIGHDHPQAHFFDGSVEALVASLGRIVAAPQVQRPLPQSWSDRYGMEQWLDAYELLMVR